MLSAAQVALFGALLAHFAHAFSPVFTSPRQCESLKITWSESSLELPVVDMPLTEILMSLIPLDNDPSRIAPEPYTLSVPSGGHEIAALPFPGGTQFFATADILGAAGHVRRTLSKVFTVEHSTNAGCLPTKAVRPGAKVKSFGKRQISVLGPSLVDSTGVPPANAIASPSNGVSTTSSSSAASPSSTDGAVPPIKVIGTSNIPASGAPVVPGNVAPAPSASGAAPPIQVIGTSFVTASGAAPPQASQSNGSSSHGAHGPTGTAAESSATGTEMPMETVTMTSMHNIVVTQTATVTMTMSMGEEPCTDDMNSMEHRTMHGTIMPSETTTSMPEESTQSANTEVAHYTVYADMVNAANSMFKAWNPYKPAFTPGTGN